MKAALLIVSLSAASLLSANAFAGANLSGTTQVGLGNLSVVGQSVGKMGLNAQSTFQFGALNAAGTSQTTGKTGVNLSSTGQFGIGNTAVTVQSAH